MDTNTLRQEGNELYNKKKYKEALQKYNEAIDVYPYDHLSWSNRAITHIKLENYTQALADGKRCIEIEPEFARGYHRIANAFEHLNRHAECLAALNKSLQLDPNNIQVKEDRKRVEKLIKRNRQTSSQVQTINYSMKYRLSDACNAFEEGLNETRSSFRNSSYISLPNSFVLAFTIKSGIENITNGIMNDDRCFHSENDEGEIMKKAIMMECYIKRPLDPDTMSAEEMIGQYRIKKQRVGWDAVRMELTANIRIYFLLGYLGVKFSGKGNIMEQEQRLEGGTESLQKSVDLIIAARSIDPGVRHSNRGVIFKPTFIRCLRIHLIAALMKLYELKRDHQILNRIENEATNIIISCKNNLISRDLEPMEYMCYFSPHFSKAYAGLGFVAHKRFNNKLKDEPDFEVLKLAINNYEKSSQYLPNDDPDKARMIYDFTFCKLRLGNFSFVEIRNHVTEAEKVERDATGVLGGLGEYVDGYQPKIDVIKFLKNIKRPDNIAKDGEFILPPLYDIDFKDKNFGQILTLKVKQHTSVSGLTEEVAKVKI